MNTRSAGALARKFVHREENEECDGPDNAGEGARAPNSVVQQPEHVKQDDDGQRHADSPENAAFAKITHGELLKSQG